MTLTAIAQPKVHHVSLAVLTNELQAAIDVAAIAAASQVDEHASLNTVGKLQTAGVYHLYLCTVITESLISALSVS
jgi:uncharacterized membrane protein